MTWTATPLSELGPTEPIPWLWHGYLAPGHVTLFTGIWKGGKTTLLAHLLRQFHLGGELGTSVETANVLVVSEEAQALWVKRREELRLGDHVHVICRPFKARPSRAKWQQFVGWLTSVVAEEVERLIRQQETDVFPTSSFGPLIEAGRLLGVEVGDLPWIEIDSMDDYQRAVDEVLPRLGGGA